MPKYYKNGGLPENWMALYLAIRKRMTGTQAIAAMHLKYMYDDEFKGGNVDHENQRTARKAEETRRVHHKE